MRKFWLLIRNKLEDEKMSTDKLGNYFRYHANELSRQAEHIGEMFAAHRPSSGANKEDRIKKFFADHLSADVGIGTGLIASDATIATEQDVVLYDKSSPPLHGDATKSIFLIETIYGVIECKTNLTREEFHSSVEKFTKIDYLPRHVLPELSPKIDDMLYCIFGFNGPSEETLKSYFEQAYSRKGARLPDLIVVPGRYVAIGGKYRILARFGQEGSDFRAMRALPPGDLSRFFDIYSLADEALFVFFFYLQKWLWTAGRRRPDLLAYRPANKEYGSFATYELTQMTNDFPGVQIKYR
jgi:hypothetical protein